MTCACLPQCIIFLLPTVVLFHSGGDAFPFGKRCTSRYVPLPTFSNIYGKYNTISSGGTVPRRSSMMLYSGNIFSDEIYYDDDAPSKDITIDPRTMRVADIKGELDLRGVSYDDCFDKESLVERLTKARKDCVADPSILDKFNKANLEAIYEGRNMSMILKDWSETDLDADLAKDGTITGGVRPEVFKNVLSNPEVLTLFSSTKLQDALKLLMTGKESEFEQRLDEDSELRENFAKMASIYESIDVPVPESDDANDVDDVDDDYDSDDDDNEEREKFMRVAEIKEELDVRKVSNDDYFDEESLVRRLDNASMEGVADPTSLDEFNKLILEAKSRGVSVQSIMENIPESEYEAILANDDIIPEEGMTPATYKKFLCHPDFLALLSNTERFQEVLKLVNSGDDDALDKVLQEDSELRQIFDNLDSLSESLETRGADDTNYTSNVGVDNDDDDDDKLGKFMKEAAIKAELNIRKVSYDDCFDKQSLVQRLTKARREGVGDTLIMEEFNKINLEATYRGESVQSLMENLPESDFEALFANDDTIPDGFTPATYKKLMRNPDFWALGSSTKFQEAMKLMMAGNTDELDKRVQEDSELSQLVDKLMLIMISTGVPLPVSDDVIDKNVDTDTDEDVNDAELGKLMTVAQIKAELDVRKVSYNDCFDKESLFQRLIMVRREGLGDSSIVDQFMNLNLGRIYSESMQSVSMEDTPESDSEVPVTNDGTMSGGLTPDVYKELMSNPDLLTSLSNPKLKDAMQLLMAGNEDELDKRMKEDSELRQICEKMESIIDSIPGFPKLF